MGYNATARTPANGSTVSYGTATMSCSYNMTGGAYIYKHTIRSRKNGGAWGESSSSGVYAGTSTFTRSTTVAPATLVEWQVSVYWVDAGGTYQTTTQAIWSFGTDADTTDPTITDVTPATGNIAPGGSGVEFAATVADNVELTDAKLYIDGSLAQTWNDAGALTHVAPLSLGAHTYRWTATDSSGNTADTGTVNITITNGAPEVPSGTITVAGQTGAVDVANLGAIALSWPAFLDGNPEDSLTYTLENRAAGDAWAEVATGITSPAYEWSPNIGLGAAELRVKANDGTTDSAYLTRAGITIVSSQSPNAPTLTAPVGGETWREGETHDVTWTPASPEHPEGLPCTYEIQFSALGDFSDAVTITTTADDGTYPWTLSTDLV